MESSQEFHNVKIQTEKTLIWKRAPKKRRVWQLFDEERLLAKIAINNRSFKAVGSCKDHEFWIEPIPPEPWHWSTRKEYTREYLIKLKNADDDLRANMDWGILECRYGRSYPTGLILDNGRIYDIQYFKRIPVGQEFELLLTSVNKGDEGRVLGVSYKSEEDLIDAYITDLLGYKAMKVDAFKVKQCGIGTRPSYCWRPYVTTILE